MAGLFSGQDPKLELYSRRNMELCKDFFVHKLCTKGEFCRFAHSVDTMRAVNLKWKHSYCPKFFDGICERGIMCNFIHHPNKTRKPKKILSGQDLVEELQKLNPFGYCEEKAMSPPQNDVTFIRKKRLEKIDDVTKKLEKVQLRYE